MSSGKNPLMLMMALSMPGAAHALGLGDIHVDSALNERLAAEIDIVGANPVELAGLRAAVASREIFRRYGADRPAFLSSATFKVTQDSQGRPVLAVRSTESFTEPVVNLLVDLNWGHGELVRQYTLLLDPAGFASAPPGQTASNRLAASNIPASPSAPAPPNVPASPSAPAPPNVPASPSAPAPPSVPASASAATPFVETKTQTVARQADPPTEQSDPKGALRAVRKTTHIKVGARATLRGIAWRAGERSESDLQRMMIAIFRANPTAFDGNINRLYRGAMLTIPSHAEAAEVSKAEAKREVHAQMTAWRSPPRAAAARGAMAATPNATASSNAIERASDTPEADALDRRVKSLEQELTEMKGLLENERDQLLEIRQQAVRAGKPAPTVAPQAVAAPHAQPKPEYTAMVPIVAGLGILSTALAALYVGLRRRVPTWKGSRSDGAAATADAAAADAAAAAAAAADAVAADAVVADGMTDTLLDGTQGPAQESVQGRVQDGARTGASDEPLDDATHPMLPVISAGLAPRSEIGTAAPRAVPQAPTVNLHADTVNLRMDPLRMDPTRLDYNFLDLDLTAQHVQMPSVLNEHAVVKERRSNLADVLRLAIEREPDRHDLHMKLLEIYYSAAAANRKAFLEAVQKFARNRDFLQADQWDKIAFMGRQIASDNPLFTEESAADDDLAECA
jgi:pilus assembly protein FimV